MNKPSGTYIGNQWREGSGAHFVGRNPMTQEVEWEGCAADAKDVDEAVSAARLASQYWAHRPMQARIEFLSHFQQLVRDSQLPLAECISRETGKPLWESKQEVDTLIAKVDNSIAAQAERAAPREIPLAGYRGVLRYRPHGVMAVLGPFNLPAHLPHSHIIPALLSGNTIVFKPSECTPGVGAFCASLWHEAGLPLGVFNLVQGGRSTGEALASHPGIDGLLFTGSQKAGLALSRLFAETPEKILALELGGNNAMVVWDPADVQQAAEWIVQSAFITSGQRCVCARRLILPEGSEGDDVLNALLGKIEAMVLGAWQDNPEPFMGPLIHEVAAKNLIAGQDRLLALGGKPILSIKTSPRSPCLLSPGLIDMTGVDSRVDEEFFGPLLQVLRVPDFEAALLEVNNTKFGLSAGLVSSQRVLWDQFLSEVRAGIVNWNRPLTGASGKFPFGGVGLSGNHRPSAWFAADYCQYPMASVESDS